MVSKIFIAAGTSRYDHLPEDLQRPQLAQVVQSMVELFTGKLGYTRELEKIGDNPTSHELVTELDRWFADEKRQRSEWVGFYYTGHGELDGDSLVLLTRDSEDGLAPSTGVSAEKIGQILMSKGPKGEKRRIKNCLVILDTCHSGAGAFDIVGKLQKFFDSNDPGRFLILAAALPREKARAGALAQAIIDTVNDDSLGGDKQEFLFFDELEPAIQQRLRPYSALSVWLGSSPERMQFFPNPRHKPEIRAGVTVAEVRRAADLKELETFWGPKSRGVDVELQPGWYFTGRERVLSELSGWLHDAKDGRTRVITGGAGSGKSAILAKVVTLSDPEYRQKAPLREKRWAKAFPAGSIDLAIHAKGKTLEEVTAKMADGLGVQRSTLNVIEALQSRRSPFRIVVDALDEAREPELIARELLAPLHGLPKAKLMVGTRPEYKNKLGEDAVHVTVDQQKYIDKSDLADYVEARLLHPALRDGSPYQRKKTLARKVSRAVAEKAYPNFLIARLVAEDLLAGDKALDASEIRRRKFPNSVGNAFEQFLSRFGADKEKARDLLTPLAWAEGLGLPWGDIWPAVASALSQRRYTTDDVRWVMERAGSFIVETLEEERSAYRLYHQALADHLRAGKNVMAMEKSLTSALLSTVPVTAEGERDWFIAHPYIRNHLAEHAAAAGMLAELMVDSGFLLAANCTRLLGAIYESAVPLPMRLLRTYKAASIYIRTKPASLAFDYLRMVARQNNVHLRGMTMSGAAWSVPWAQWMPPDSSASIAVGESQVSALQTASGPSGRAAALVGRSDGRVEVWDVADNSLLAGWAPGAGEVRSIALAHTSSGPLVVAVHFKADLAVYEMSSKETRKIETSSGGDDSITAMVVAEHDGKWICITAHYNLRLAVWSLPDLRLIREKTKATGGAIYALALVAYKGRQVLLSEGDYVNRHSESHDDSTFRLWSLDDLSLLWKDGRHLDKGYVTSVETATLWNRNLALATGINKGEIWDLGSKPRVVYDEPKLDGPWLLYSHREQPVLLAYYAQRMKVLQVEKQGSPFQIVTKPTSQSFDLPGRMITPVTVSQGRDVFLTDSGKQVLIWDLRELLSSTDEGAGTTGIPTHCLERIQGEMICAASADKLVFVEGLTGKETGRLPLPRSGQPWADYAKSLAYSHQSGKLFVATDQGKILTLEPSNPATLRTLVDGPEFERLRLANCRGRAIAIATAKSGGWAARVWDAETGEELYNQRQFALRHGEEDKRLYGLAAIDLDNDVRFAFAGKYGKIMVANLEAPSSRPYQDFDEWYVPSSGGDYTHCLEAFRDGPSYFLVSSTEGELVVWDFITGKILAQEGNIPANALAVSMHDGRTRIASAGADRFLRIWTPELRKITEVEIGEPIDTVSWLDAKRIAVGTRRGLLAVEFDAGTLD